MAPKKKGGGGKLSRSMTVTVRLDPKLRFAAELAARKQRRTVSSFIEWAIEDALGRYAIHEEIGHNAEPVTTMEAAHQIWDVDEMDRFVNLTFTYPELLTHDEQMLWKLVCLKGYRGKGHHGEDKIWVWNPNVRKNLILSRLRDSWETFEKVAAGELGKDSLPKWTEEKDTNKPPLPNSETSDLGDDIPF